LPTITFIRTAIEFGIPLQNFNSSVSGTYFYQLKAGDFVAIKKLVVLK
jgi:hypothetical protein